MHTECSEQHLACSALFTVLVELIASYPLQKQCKFLGDFNIFFLMVHQC